MSPKPLSPLSDDTSYIALKDKVVMNSGVCFSHIIRVLIITEGIRRPERSESEFPGKSDIGPSFLNRFVIPEKTARTKVYRDLLIHRLGLVRSWLSLSLLS